MLLVALIDYSFILYTYNNMAITGQRGRTWVGVTVAVRTGF